MGRGHTIPVLDRLQLIFGQLRENWKNGFFCTNKNNNKTLQPYFAFLRLEKYAWQCPCCSEVSRQGWGQGKHVSSKPWRVWDQVKFSLFINDFLSICPPPNPCDLPEQRRPEYIRRRTSSYDTGQTRFHVKNWLSQDQDLTTSMSKRYQECQRLEKVP